MSKAITTAPQQAPLQAGGKIRAIIPQDAEQAFRMAQGFYEAGMVPHTLDSPQKVVTAIFAGLEIGLTPFQAVQSMAMINNRPSLWGDALPALVYGSGLVEDFDERFIGKDDSLTAVCRVKRKGVDSECERRFGVEDAKRAGLLGKKGPWQQYPKRMLQIRARAWALRDTFPDVLRGIGVAEEQQDIAYEAEVISARDADTPRVTAAAMIQQAERAPLSDVEPEAEPAVDVPAAEPEIAEAITEAVKEAKASVPYVWHYSPKRTVEYDTAEAMRAEVVRIVAGVKSMPALNGMWEHPDNQQQLARACNEGQEHDAEAIRAAFDAREKELQPPLEADLLDAG